MKPLQKSFSWITHHKKIVGGIGILLILFFVLKPKPLPTIETQTITESTFHQTIPANGTITATMSAEARFPISGNLVYLGVKKGDMVKKYQTLAVLDQRTVQKNLQAALLTYSQQRNTYDQTIDNNHGANPQSALNDQMKRVLENNQYDLQKAVVSVELQDLARQQSILTSPINGIVTNTDVTSTNTTVFTTTSITIVDPTSMVFSMDIDEADSGVITPGQAVDIVLDPYPDTPVHSQITWIDFVTHTTSTGASAYTAYASLPSMIKNYKVGMNGNATIITKTKDHVLSIPQASIVNTNQVYVKKGKTYVLTPITLGLQNDTDSEVRKGLFAGDVIALDPILAQRFVSEQNTFIRRLLPR